MKEFSKFELARLKRTAQNVQMYLTQKAKLEAQKASIDVKLEEVNKLIEITDAPTRMMTGGYGTADIIKKVVTPTDGVNKNGTVIKQTSYEFIYPDTIIPPTKNTEENLEDSEENTNFAPTDEETVDVDTIEDVLRGGLNGADNDIDNN